MSDPATPRPAHHHTRRERLSLPLLRARPRMIASAAILITTAVLLAVLGMPPTEAALLGFDLGALVYLIMLARMFYGATPDFMRTQARRQDGGRWGILWSRVALSLVVMAALTTELGGRVGIQGIGLAVLSIVLSWLFMNTVFALHYAHGYYGEYGKQAEGLDFPGTKEPDYWDFAYFAIVIGMTFQVSDVQITSRYLRRMALLHGVIAFFFNVFILAVSINIVAGKV